ncbi:MAG TPA: TadE/TadG family type IV pilus assembly protein [Archangium sp.]|uniref:TadE/TadG family type IV pilus assembly protein n=1 Tax=Archangium sp. TaxID=1872627 RepID=UPI002E3046E7|nr:TadE/TadG family type IV pilus assembly protein [Archangium sp.]HEX5747885.1 TadE/TadG family type IV pilus assembly protein [Archangium sp.]
MSEHLSRDGQSGQAAVESALVLPLMVFLGLGLLQLTQMQQAKLMTEYAAYCAARSGIVWNGNAERMRDAALVAVLPTLGRTDAPPELARTWTRARLLDEMLRRLPWPTRDTGVPDSVNGAPLSGLVRVDTVSPSGFSPKRGELEFDGPEGLAEEVYREATVLSVRVRYWYELRVPFANQLVFTAWWAANAGAGPSHQRGYATLHRRELGVLRGLAADRRYFLPLTATYSLRMQSNFHSKWLMHPNPDGGAVTP